MWLGFVHSIKMGFIEYWFPHWHFEGGSSLRIKEWVSWVCPMRSRVRVVSSLLVLLGSSFLSFKIGCIWKSLLWGFSSQLILDSDTWNHTTVYKLFALDKNTWYITVCKQMIIDNFFINWTFLSIIICFRYWICCWRVFSQVSTHQSTIWALVYLMIY